MLARRNHKEDSMVPVILPGSGDVYFSVDIETDGPIPGPFSLLSFGIVVAGRFDGNTFERSDLTQKLYRELRPISNDYEQEALNVNGLDRERLMVNGAIPDDAMTELAQWVKRVANGARPVLVAYPLSFDWSWLYWYFIQFSREGSPFSHSSCFDIKTAYAVKANLPVSTANRAGMPIELRPKSPHTHNALDDAIEQAELFANVFEWQGHRGISD
jgi:hypothetical protein